jgi:hypothetical protein
MNVCADFMIPTFGRQVTIWTGQDVERSGSRTVFLHVTEGLGIATKNICRSLVRDLKPGPDEHKAGS